MSVFKSMKKVCEICGKKWEYAQRIRYNQDGTVECFHDDSVDGEEVFFRQEIRRMKRRRTLIERHKAGNLPSSYYAIDPATGKKALLPSKLYKDGY